MPFRWATAQSLWDFQKHGKIKEEDRSQHVGECQVTRWTKLALLCNTLQVTAPLRFSFPIQAEASSAHRLMKILNRIFVRPFPFSKHVKQTVT